MKRYHEFFSFRLIVIMGLFACYGNSAIAQKAFNCSKLLKQNIVPEKPQDITGNLEHHADCFGLDSVDLRVFNNGPMLGSLTMKRAQSGQKNITYADLITDINKVKKDTGYTSMHNLTTAQMTLEKRRFTPDNWEECLKYLQMVGMPGGDTEGFHKYALEKKEHHWTYRQLIVGYQMKKDAEAPLKQ